MLVSSVERGHRSETHEGVGQPKEVRTPDGGLALCCPCSERSRTGREAVALGVRPGSGSSGITAWGGSSQEVHGPG